MGQKGDEDVVKDDEDRGSNRRSTGGGVSEIWENEAQGRSNLRVLLPGWRNMSLYVSDPRVSCVDRNPDFDPEADPFDAAGFDTGLGDDWVSDGWLPPHSMNRRPPRFQSTGQDSTNSMRRCHSSETFRTGSKSKRPIAVWRQNWSLGIGEPASVSKDSSGARTLAGTGLVSTFPLREGLRYKKDPPVDSSLMSRQYKFRRSATEEKELCTLLVPSRWRWKPRHGYSPEKEHTQTHLARSKVGVPKPPRQSQKAC